MERDCSCIRCGYALGGATCPECGASAAESREQWARLGGEVETLRCVRRATVPLAVLVSFQALGWSCSWLRDLTVPSITIGSRGYVFRFDIVLEAPFLVASVVTSALWVWMTCRPHPWDGGPARRIERVITVAWCAAACAALIPSDAKRAGIQWMCGALQLPISYVTELTLLHATNIPLLPIAAGTAALRLTPPRAFAAWRERCRWLRRGAVATLVASAALATLVITNTFLTLRGSFGQGAQRPWSGAKGILDFLHDAAIATGSVATPVILMILAVSLLHLITRAALAERAASTDAGAPSAPPWQRGTVAAAIGGVLLVMIMVSTVIEMTRAHWAWWDHEFDTYAQVGVALLRTGWPFAQLPIVALMTGVVLLWIVAALAPGYCVRRAIARAAPDTMRR